jgi:hypothetical protein
MRSADSRHKRTKSTAVLTHQAEAAKKAQPCTAKIRPGEASVNAPSPNPAALAISQRKKKFQITTTM